MDDGWCAQRPVTVETIWRVRSGSREEIRERTEENKEDVMAVQRLMGSVKSRLCVRCAEAVSRQRAREKIQPGMQEERQWRVKDQNGWMREREVKSDWLVYACRREEKKQDKVDGDGGKE